MQQIQPEDIITLLKKEDHVVISEKRIIQDLIISNTESISCSEIKFVNSEIRVVKFLNINFNIRIKFIGCNLDHLIFENCKVKKNNDDIAYESFTLQIQNSIISTTLSIKDTYFNRGFHIEKSEIKQFFLTKFICKDSDILFENLKVKEIFNITQLESGRLIFRDSDIICHLSIDNYNGTNFSLIKTHFQKFITIWGGEITNDLIFNDGIFSDSVTIKAVKSKGNLSLIDADFKKDLNIQYSDKTNKKEGGFSTIYISNVIISGKASFIGYEKESYYYEVDKLEINLSEKCRGDFNFKNFIFNYTILTGSNFNAKISFNHILFIKLEIKDFVNNFKIHFYDIKAKLNSNSILKIYKSNLGQIEFYNTDLSTFKFLEIKSSILSDVIASNVIWFNKEQLTPKNYLSRKELEIEWKNNREVFRQLKYAMEKQGNKIQSLDFKSYEMECFKQELFQQHNNYVNVWNKIILWLNQSNDFGINYIKPFVLIIVTAITFYILIVIGVSPKLSFRFGEELSDINATFNEFKYYSYGFPKMLSPVYDFTKTFNLNPIEEKKLSFWVSFADILYRIILSYLIFQLISAFRKFVK